MRVQIRDFTDDMDQLAAEIAVAAGAQGVPLGDRIDAFRALIPYYAIQMKNRGKSVDQNEDLPNFDNFTNKIHAVK